jgi:hypothetical protein
MEPAKEQKWAVEPYVRYIYVTSPLTTLAVHISLSKNRPRIEKVTMKKKSLFY